MVLKKNEVRLAEPCRIGEDAREAVCGPAASARIVAQDEAGATVEVTCPCGWKVQLQCLYATAAAKAAPAQAAQ